MANVDATTSNCSNQTVGGDALFAMNAARSDIVHSLYNTLLVVRTSVASVLVSVMLISNVLTLCAVWIMPRLRVKTYALTTSMTASNVLLSISLVQRLVHDVLGPMPCSLKLYKAVVRPVECWVMGAAFLHVSVIAVDRYIAVMHSLHYENRVTQRRVTKMFLACNGKKYYILVLVLCHKNGTIYSQVNDGCLTRWSS